MDAHRALLADAARALAADEAARFVPRVIGGIPRLSAWAAGMVAVDRSVSPARARPAREAPSRKRKKAPQPQLSTDPFDGVDDDVDGTIIVWGTPIADPGDPFDSGPHAAGAHRDEGDGIVDDNDPWADCSANCDTCRCELYPESGQRCCVPQVLECCSADETFVVTPECPTTEGCTELYNDAIKANLNWTKIAGWIRSCRRTASEVARDQFIAGKQGVGNSEECRAYLQEGKKRKEARDMAADALFSLPNDCCKRERTWLRTTLADTGLQDNVKAIRDWREDQPVNP